MRAADASAGTSNGRLRRAFEAVDAGEPVASAGPDRGPEGLSPADDAPHEPEPDAEAAPTISLSPAAQSAGDACVQCGLCLPACPTYLETGNEADSPRGRIRLMLGLHQGDVPFTPAAQQHLDGCLGCRACETACPSGVTYHRLLDDAIGKLAHDRRDGGAPVPRLTRLQRAIVLGLLARPNRLRLALAVARLGDRVGLRAIARRLGVMRLMPATLRRMDALLPRDDAAPIWPRPLPPHSRSGGMDMVVQMLDPARAEAAEKVILAVSFFEGCVAGVMSPRVHAHAAELLCHAGADVVSPPDQVCCGAIHQHAAEGDLARHLARVNVDTYVPREGAQVRFITTCTAGDGAMLREYGHLLADEPAYAARAATFADKVRDISEVLLEIGLGEGELRFRHDVPVRVAYHDACHLAHAQGVRSAPRELLARVPGLEVIDLPESDVCCGAAGTYNLTQPEMAGRLGERKLSRFEETGAQLLVSGNIGCTMHLDAVARGRRRPVRVVHPVEILHAAGFGRGG